MKVQLIAHSPDPDKIIAAAAKLCYSAVGTGEILEGRPPEKTEKFIRLIILYKVKREIYVYQILTK